MKTKVWLCNWANKENTYLLGVAIKISQQRMRQKIELYKFIILQFTQHTSAVNTISLGTTLWIQKDMAHYRIECDSTVICSDSPWHGWQVLEKQRALSNSQKVPALLVELRITKQMFRLSRKH